MKKTLYDYSIENNLPNIVKDYRGEIDIKKIGFDSTKKVKWVCDKGHEVIESPHVRLRRKGAFCPVCGKNHLGSLAQCYPELAKMYTENNKVPADKLPADSSYRAEWKCEHGHVWHRAVKSQTKIGTCPVCANRVPSEKYSFFKLHPELLEEWDAEKNGDVDISKLMPSSNRKYWWTCKEGHSYLCTIADRSRGKGCPICAGKKVTEENSVAKTKPEILKIWDYNKNTYLPTELSEKSKRKIWIVIDGESKQVSLADCIKSL